MHMGHQKLQHLLLCMQAVWSQLWQGLIALLAATVMLLALQKDKGKLPFHQQSASNGQQPSKLQ